VAQITFYLILWLLLVNLAAATFVLSGPMGRLYCSAELIAMNVIAMQCLLLFNGIAVAKHIFVFRLKNPLAVQEDFFAVFIHAMALLIRYLRTYVGFFWFRHHCCQIFLCRTYQNREKYAKRIQNIPNDHKKYQMTIKNTK
jgi:hypothetical protein